MIKKLLVSLLALAVGAITVSPVLAKSDYDEDVVRAFKKLKVKKVSTNIKLPEYATDDEIKAEIQAFLLKKKYFKKKLKNKSAVVLVTPKVDDETLKIKHLYIYKNPEIFLYSYDKNTPRSVLSQRDEVSKKIEENVTLYAITSNKIAKQNQWKIRKAGKFLSNFTLSTFTLLPKLGLGYIINPPFNWLKTGTAPDIHKHILKEVEMLMTDEKDYGKILYIDKDVLVKIEPKKEVKVEPVKLEEPKVEEMSEEQLLKKLEEEIPAVEIKKETVEKISDPKIEEEPISIETPKEEPKVEEEQQEEIIEIKEEIKTEPEATQQKLEAKPAAEMPQAEVGDSDTKAKEQLDEE